MPPNFAIIAERKMDGFTVIEIDTNKASYQGVSWKTMGDFGKRKFENLLVLGRTLEKLKVIYI